MMDFAELAAHIDAAVAQHQRLGLPDEMSPFENLSASDADLERVEEELGVRLPDQYRSFMKRYGGGAFGSLDLLPAVCPAGDRREDMLEVARSEQFEVAFVPIAPVGTGDWWGFEVVEGVCREPVCMYLFEDGTLETASPDFITFAAKEGLRVDSL
ncbi:SMI1/KNR4 family protein [Streptomyces puniciscabiei]